MESKLTVIVGAQWGDEGKGKITDFFAGDSKFVVRYQGGNNAGHTLVVGDQVYKLHLIPSGVLYPKTTSVIGSGVLMDPGVLIGEIKALRERGVAVNLKISERCHVIMPYHIAMDEGLSKLQGELAAGSTKRGIAPVAADKMYRHGIRLGDLLEPALFKEKLKTSYAFNTAVIKNVFNLPFEKSLDSIYEEYCSYGQALKEFITDTEVLLADAYKAGNSMLFEGAQGMSLDPDQGIYPHTTSSNNISGFIEVGTGVGYNTHKRVIGVAKAYVSRVGVSPFPTELLDDDGEKLRKKGNEYGTTTGRPRRVGWLDLVQIRQTVRVSGLTDIAITKLDILAGLGDIKVCVAYDINGERVREMPASLEKFRAAKPMYETLPGWDAMSAEEARAIVSGGYEKLPSNIKKYLEFIEKEVGCRVNIISLGAGRAETIVRS
jgi:adenylosuccinate synthase